ncbi:MAG: substrate-binding domain-containing protein [Qingshengfaniella sp.]
MQKIRITDICHATGLSRSTIDRALNGRGNVHPRTARLIQRAIRHLAQPSAPRPPEAAGPPVDVLYRLGTGMSAQMQQMFTRLKGPDDRLIDLFQMNEESILRELRMVCADRERALVVTVQDTTRIRQVLTWARKAGKRIVAMISDLERPTRDHFLGIDNKSAGATAAHLVAQRLGDRPATVGVIVGDAAFRCHEDREIGFRTNLREVASKAVVAAEARGEDNPDKTYFAILKMLEAHPGIGAIYNVGGGNTGLARALTEAGLARDVLVITHELTHVSVPLLIEGTLDYALSQDPEVLLDRALQLARAPDPTQAFDGPIDFGIFTRFNLPSYTRHFDLDPMPQPAGCGA